MQCIVSRDIQSDFESSWDKSLQDSLREESDEENSEYESDLLENEIDYSNVTNTSEVNLSDDILDQLDYIVRCRWNIFSALSIITPDDHRVELKRALLRRVEELETRAVIFLTLPPQALGTEETYLSAEEDIQTHFNRFLADADSYLVQTADLLESRETKDEDRSHTDIFHATAKKSEFNKQTIAIDGLSLSQAVEITTKVEDSIFYLLSNPNLRSYTALVKMIIGLACSQITGNDPEHCINRLNYMLTFFEGSPVRPPGIAYRNDSDLDNGKVFSIHSLPSQLGSKYAWHCLITASLAQACHQFAYSLDNTLPFAAVLATLLARYPDEVPHFLSRVVLACPILSSFSVGDMSVSSPDLADPDEKTLLEWRGLSRLFAAVLLAKTPPGFPKRPNMLNPKLLWLILAGIVRNPFIKLSTAEVLLGLIEIGGFLLLRLYGRQAARLFRAILHTINNSPTLAHSAPELALVNCIEVGLSKGKFPGRIGILPENFWI